MHDQIMSTQPPHPVEHAAAIIESERIRAQRIEPRIRRFTRALSDLGLIGVVGAGWATVGDADPDSDEPHIAFAELPGHAFDRLVVALEDLADQTVAVSPQPGPGQLSFDI